MARLFVQEDAAHLPAADLVTRCRVALAGSDRAQQYLLARYVGRRVAAANQAGAEGQEPDMAADDRHLLGTLIEQLQATVRGAEGAKKAEAARAVRTAWQGVRARSIALHDAAHSRDRRTESALRSTGRYNF